MTPEEWAAEVMQVFEGTAKTVDGDTVYTGVSTAALIRRIVRAIEQAEADKVRAIVDAIYAVIGTETPHDPLSAQMFFERLHGLHKLHVKLCESLL